MYWAGRGDLPASLALIFPLWLGYQIGVVFAGHVNGADLVTRALYMAIGPSSYLLVTAATALVFLIWLRATQRWAALRLEVVVPVVLEAAVYAVTLGVLVSLGVHYALERVLGLGLTSGSLVNALGAGVHEELVFRLGLIGVVIVTLGRTSLRPDLVVAIALLISAFGFAAAHHVGAFGEPFAIQAFVFRCVAGLVFGLVFWFRSLAHAVYAHALYDVWAYW